MPGERYENFIGIEGGDGSGKATQTKLLGEYAVSLGLNVKQWSFPRYGEPSAEIAGKYLDGQYGSIEQIHPDLGSLPYTIDRFVANAEIRSHLALISSLGLTDRFSGSNLAHQGAKIDDEDERHAFYDRHINLEHGLLNVPRPGINVVILVPAKTAQLNVDKKDQSTRSYTSKVRDIHEADPLHLEKAKANYEELCKLYPEFYTAVKGTDRDDAMRSREAIERDIRSIVNIEKFVTL